MNRRDFLKVGLSLPFSPLTNLDNYEEKLYFEAKKDIYLTIDDGPRQNLENILKNIMPEDRLTFFVLGCLLENKNGHLAACNLLEKGHALGNHSYSHPNFSFISLDEAKKEIEKTHILLSKIYKDVSVKEELLFRFPYGNPGFQVIKWNNNITGSPEKKQELNKFLKSLGYKIYYWDFDMEDWEYYKHKKTISDLLCEVEEFKENQIVMAHEIPVTIEIILPYCIELGIYNFKKLPKQHC